MGELGRGGSGVEGASGEVSGQVGELDEGEGEGWRVAGREGARPRVELLGRVRKVSDLRLVEEEPICLGGKLHRRTSWVERALHREGLLQRAQKAWAYGTSDHLSFCLRKLVRF